MAGQCGAAEPGVVLPTLQILLRQQRSHTQWRACSHGREAQQCKHNGSFMSALRAEQHNKTAPKDLEDPSCSGCYPAQFASLSAISIQQVIKCEQDDLGAQAAESQVSFRWGCDGG